MHVSKQTEAPKLALQVVPVGQVVLWHVDVQYPDRVWRRQTRETGRTRHRGSARRAVRRRFVALAAARTDREEQEEREGTALHGGLALSVYGFRRPVEQSSSLASRARSDQHRRMSMRVSVLCALLLVGCGASWDTAVIGRSPLYTVAMWRGAEVRGIEARRNEQIVPITWTDALGVGLSPTWALVDYHEVTDAGADGDHVVVEGLHRVDGTERFPLIAPPRRERALAPGGVGGRAPRRHGGRARTVRGRHRGPFRAARRRDPLDSRPNRDPCLHHVRRHDRTRWLRRSRRRRHRLGANVGGRDRRNRDAHHRRREPASRSRTL